MTNTDFYTSLAPWYDRIFPPSTARRDFLLSLLPREGGRIVDLGCATGALLDQLRAVGHEVWGLDLDPALVARARERCPDLDEAHLAVLDMRQVTDLLPPESLQLACCFGNTLVHLPSLEEVGAFCRAVASRLHPGGRFVGQIVNYDRVLAMPRPGLPAIDGEGLRFERNYRLRPDGRLDFLTRLTAEGLASPLENVVPLLPLRRPALEAELAAAGFEDLRFWGDWSFTPWTRESGPTIWEARRTG